MWNVIKNKNIGTKLNNLFSNVINKKLWNFMTKTNIKNVIKIWNILKLILHLHQLHSFLIKVELFQDLLFQLQCIMAFYKIKPLTSSLKLYNSDFIELNS